MPFLWAQQHVCKLIPQCLFNKWHSHLFLSFLPIVVLWIRCTNNTCKILVTQVRHWWLSTWFIKMTDCGQKGDFPCRCCNAESTCWGVYCNVHPHGHLRDFICIKQENTIKCLEKFKCPLHLPISIVHVPTVKVEKLHEKSYFWSLSNEGHLAYLLILLVHFLLILNVNHWIITYNRIW